MPVVVCGCVGREEGVVCDLWVLARSERSRLWLQPPQRSTIKDNTGRRTYVEDMVFPTLKFPSDHGLVWTKLKLN